MKMTTIAIAGKKYPGVLTVSSAIEIMEEYEDIKNGISILRWDEIRKAMVDSMKIVSILLKGGQKYKTANHEEAEWTRRHQRQEPSHAE